MAIVKIGLFMAIFVAFLAMGVGIVSADPVLNPANGHYYEVVSAPNTGWTAASVAASERTIPSTLWYGHLVTVTSQAENDFIVTTFGAGSLSNKWCGGFQDDTNSSTVNIGWQWITGEAWSYTNWNPGEPNNGNYGSAGYEDRITYWDATGKWNDAPTEWQYSDGGYIVEWDPIQALIDIKPGSYPNSINNDGKGVIPVAILTTDDFDASTVDPSTITLDGAAARIKGNSGNVGSLQDVDGDGDLDLVFQIQDTDGTYTLGDTVATLHAVTYDGVNVWGTDTIRIVPPA